MQQPEDQAVPISAADALRTLGEWAAEGTDVGILYTRSDGGFLAALRGRLRVEEHLLTLRGDGTLLSVWIAGARFRSGPISMVRPDLSWGESADGLHLYTEKGDWLFLSRRPGSGLPSVGLEPGAS